MSRLSTVIVRNREYDCIRWPQRRHRGKLDSIFMSYLICKCEWIVYLCCDTKRIQLADDP